MGSREFMRLAAAVVTVLASCSAAAGQIRTVVVTNLESPPGAPLGAHIGQICNFFSAQPGFNNAGGVAFRGDMSAGYGGVTTSTNSGIWSTGLGALALVAREGSQAPGAPAGAVFDDISQDPRMNGRGQVAFTGFLREGVGGVTSATESGVWSQRTGALGLVARAGNQAPGTPAGANFVQFYASNYGNDLFAFNDAGQTAFNARLATTDGGVTADNSSGIWSDPGGVLTLVAREGDPAPGTPAGTLFDDFDSPLQSPVLNDRGQIAVPAYLRVGTGGVTTNNDEGVWLGMAGAMNLVVRKGAAAPGIPAGGVFQHFNELRLNDAGHLLFRASLRIGPGGVTTADDGSMWTTRHGNLTLVAREGGQIPGEEAGVNWGQFYYYALNNRGQIALNGYLQTGSGGVTEDNDGFIGSERGDNFQIIAREGEFAPGTSAGEVFDYFSAPALNAAGQVAFTGHLKSGVGGVTTSNDQGIWAQDIYGGIHLIAREGDLFESKPGDFDPITFLSTPGNSGNADGLRTMFNDRGELAFWVQAGWQGIYISGAVKNPFADGDFDENGAVSGGDLASWRTGWGAGVGALHTSGDANYDGDVDGGDFLTWQREFDANAGAAAGGAGVPEPGAGVLSALGVIAAQRRRSRDTR